MVMFPKQDLATDINLHRLLEHSCGMETYPGLLSLGSRSAWISQDSKASRSHHSLTLPFGNGSRVGNREAGQQLAWWRW